ncbi:uncharacterized protein LOC120626054, partial [Pararge aegeria]|uniref:uncharacterized protein LOC120626054 n=1 Tax=Pararge aegeria TaxID=116150 RepID=UPI0019D09D24
APGAEPTPRRWRCESPERARATDSAPRPEFALPDNARAAPEPPADAARRSPTGAARSCGARPRACVEARAAVHALLAASGALYALAFLAFYFLSLQ